MTATARGSFTCRPAGSGRLRTSGLLPIGSNDIWIWLHAVLGIIAGAVALAERRTPVGTRAL